MFELFLIPLLVFPAFAESIPDYNDPYSPIFTDKASYSWTEKIKMKIIAPSWNTNRNLIDSIGDDTNHAIKISTRGHSLDQYRFAETDVNSGIFSADVTLTGFLHDADGDGNFDTNPRTTGTGPTSGFLEVDRDSAVTISFEFADGVVLTESVPVSWNLGTIEFQQEIFLSSDIVTIRVVDLDMNLNPEAIDQIPIHVYSDSDVAGINVDGIEISDDSGMFIATVSLTSSSISSGNRLYSVPGDNIHAKYDDHTLPKPYSINDDLEIQTSALIDSSIPPIERLDNTSIIFSDGLGNPLQSVSSFNQIQIVGNVINPNDFKQKFVYLFQVKNSENIVELVSWVQGEINSMQSLDVSQSWTPKKSGEHIVEIFVWDSLVDPTVLSPIMSKTIMVE